MVLFSREIKTFLRVIKTQFNVKKGAIGHHSKSQLLLTSESLLFLRSFPGMDFHEWNCFSVNNLQDSAGQRAWSALSSQQQKLPSGAD